MNRKRTYFLAVLLLVLAACLAGAISFSEKDASDIPAAVAGTINSSAIIAGPYVQNMTTDAVTIMWQTAKPVVAILTVSGKGAEKSYTVAKTQRLNEVRVDGLDPDTSYSYTIKLAGGTEPVVESGFRTFPSKIRPVKFIVYGDSRSGIARHKAVINAMTGEGSIDFVMHSGDIVDSGRKITRWIPMFFEPAKKLIPRVPFYFTLGNHEDNSPYYFRYFDLPGNERWYSFDCANIHIIALDSCSDFREGTAQYKWLVSDLEKNKNAKWKIVVMHHPVYSSGTHAAVDGSGLPIERGMRTARTLMPKLAKKYHIQAFFGGHDHAYERSERDGVDYIVSGGGGAGSYSDPNADHNPYRKVFHSEVHYCVVTVNGNRAHVVAKTPKGKILDQFDLN